jgi:formylglycine-generating enzyme required for sulfatase activity
MTAFTLRPETKRVPYFVEPLTDDLGLDMVQVPAGTFQMGSAEEDSEAYKDERPQHEVTVPSFFMGRYPVTQAQWRFVAALPQVNSALKPDPSEFKGDQHPVESVSWYDAVEFCDRLARFTQRPYRLPSESEWEYACRAGTSTAYWFGDRITPELANYDAGDDKKSGQRGTTSVDHFPYANPWGLQDMHGNVWEWCADYWHGGYEGAPTDGSAWLTEDKDAGRVARGGSWFLDPWDCRAAYRNDFDPRESNFVIGFRVSCSAPRALR